MDFINRFWNASERIYRLLWTSFCYEPLLLLVHNPRMLETYR